MVQGEKLQPGAATEDARDVPRSEAKVVQGEAGEASECHRAGGEERHEALSRHNGLLVLQKEAGTRITGLCRRHPYIELQALRADDAGLLQDVSEEAARRLCQEEAEAQALDGPLRDGRQQLPRRVGVREHDLPVPLAIVVVVPVVARQEVCDVHCEVGEQAGDVPPPPRESAQPDDSVKIEVLDDVEQDVVGESAEPIVWFHPALHLHRMQRRLTPAALLLATSAAKCRPDRDTAAGRCEFAPARR